MRLGQKSCFVSLFVFVLFCQALYPQVDVTTYHYDPGRIGANTNEAVLTPSNVNVNTFGKLFSYTFDNVPHIYAQPLYLPNVSIGGQLHNVLYIATELDTVLALDADRQQTLWQADLAAVVGGTPVSSLAYSGYMGDAIGICGTPVIDAATGTLYVITKTQEGPDVVERLHALDLTNGTEKFGGPVRVQATIAGTGTGSSNGLLSFDPKTAHQRAGLLFVNGVVYIAWGSFADTPHYHGWVMAYDGTSLQQLAAFATTPNGGNFSCVPYVHGCDGEGGGVWTNGGVAADQSGNVFAGSGNGTFDASQGNYGNSFVKLQAGNLNVLDFFTPFNVDSSAPGFRNLNDSDLDLGGGVVLLPDQPASAPHLMISAGKEGRIYLLNRDSMGGFTAGGPDAVIQESAWEVIGASGCSGSGSGADGCNRTTPAFWNNLIYFHGKDDVLKAFAFNGSAPSFSTSPVSSGTIVFHNPSNPETRGATPIVSADDNVNGIVWELRVDGTNVPAILYAYDAMNLTNNLYSSDQNPGRDNAGNGLNFITPIVANGKVYVATKSQVTVYGLLASLSHQGPTAVFSVTPSSGAAPLPVTASTSASSDPDGTIVSSWIDFGDGTRINKTTAQHTYTAPGTYTLIATIYDDAGVSSRATATITVTSGTAPTVQLSANPSTIMAGQSSTLTWSSTNATSVTISGVGTFGPSGTTTVTPSSTTTYTATATGSGGSATASTTVTVQPSQTCTPDPQSMTVCSPTAGSTVTSPVTFLAAANASSGIDAMAIYVDSQLAYGPVNASSINTSLNIITGPHDITVQARVTATTETVIKNSFTITVTSTPITTNIHGCPHSVGSPGAICSTRGL